MRTLALTLLVAMSALHSAQAQVRITEFMYAGEEFIELTNVGSAAVDASGWTYTGAAGQVPVALADFGWIAAGESVLIAERGAEAFREAYGLCAGVKVVGGTGNRIGRAGEIEIRDGEGGLVDRLAYDDRVYPGSPRAQNAAAWVQPSGLGTNDPVAWTLASVGDAEGSVASANGYPGSPGRSSRASVVFDPCAQPQRANVRITEYAYGGIEFVEFANIGEQPIDLDGFSFDDDRAVPGSVDLSAFGVLAPGETALLSEFSAEEFRSRFGLCAQQKLIGGLARNLGRNDAIHLFDAQGLLVDRLAFGDQNFPGSVRADVSSAWVSAAGLGADDPFAWTLSSPGDAEASRAATSPAGFHASPGSSTRTRVLFEACQDAGPRLRLTEYMYSGANGEFMEFTNVGDAPLDLSGWSFSDSARNPGGFDLSAAGVLQAGESLVLTESDAEAFRGAWNLCAGQKILGGSQPGIGRADEINVYDGFGRRVDRLTYDDQNLGGPRTQNIAGWPLPEALGANLHAGWRLAIPGDAEGSYASAGGDIGSPGRSTLASVAFDPCVAQPGVPRLVFDADASSPFLQGGSAGAVVSAVIDDPSDPAAVDGLAFRLEDDDTPLDQLLLTVSSSQPGVVPPEGLLLEGEGAQRRLRIVPIGIGYSTLRLELRDPEGRIGQYLIQYAASAAAAEPARVSFHTGASDASTALPVGEGLMFVADDENQMLRLYLRAQSGLPVAGFDFSTSLGLAGGANPDEVDIEGSTRIGDRLFWMGSLGNNRSGAARPNRNRVFATTLGEADGLPSLDYLDRYDHLRTDLIAWDVANGHGLGADALGFAAAAATGVPADEARGFNVEGLAMAPDGSSAWLAFRAPLLPRAGGLPALLVPVLAFEALVVDGSPGSRPAGSAGFGAPIFLDLGGRSIRSIERLTDGDYLLVAGPPDYASDQPPSDFRLFIWSGQPDEPAEPLPARLSALEAGGSFEAIVDAPPGLRVGGGTVELLVDNGDTVFYGDGVIAKDLSERRLAKFRSMRIEVAPQAVFGNGFEAGSD